MSTYIHCGAVLSDLMKQFDVNALELERLTGVPSSTIYRLVKNKDGNPTIEVLKKLASFFQITVSQLIGEDPIGQKQIPLIPTDEIIKFLKSKLAEKLGYRTITVDFPLSIKCFATIAQDELMEPFILRNSIVIIDPEREATNKDFVLFIKKGSTHPQIRQIIKDGADTYLKILNTNYPINISKMSSKAGYDFLGVIVHYRMNLFSFDKQ
jgi:transcriptional regulator with XRE-family HTH domain